MTFMNFKKTAMGLVSGVLAAGSLLSIPFSTFAGEHHHHIKSQNLISSKKHHSDTTTPIKHLVVLFDENVSFDHYFGTYPYAKNPKNEPPFKAKPHTPRVNGLTKDLLEHNPNLYNPKRLDRSQAMTDDMDHSYTDEQKAFNGGKMDKFVEYTSGSGKDKSLVMDYYDGNTVTALWNYAQNFSMSDNSFGTTFGPSTPGAINLISGQTHGATAYVNGKPVEEVKNEVANGTVFGDPEPYYDEASNPTKPQVAMSGKISAIY